MSTPKLIQWYDVTTIGSAYAEETDGNGNWRHRPLIVRQDCLPADMSDSARRCMLGLLMQGEHRGIGEWCPGPAPTTPARAE